MLRRLKCAKSSLGASILLICLPWSQRVRALRAQRVAPRTLIEPGSNGAEPRARRKGCSPDAACSALIARQKTFLNSDGPRAPEAHAASALACASAALYGNSNIQQSST